MLTYITSQYNAAYSYLDDTYEYYRTYFIQSLASMSILCSLVFLIVDPLIAAYGLPSLGALSYLEFYCISIALDGPKKPTNKGSSKLDKTPAGEKPQRGLLSRVWRFIKNDLAQVSAITTFISPFVYLANLRFPLLKTPATKVLSSFLWLESFKFYVTFMLLLIITQKIFLGEEKNMDAFEYLSLTRMGLSVMFAFFTHYAFLASFDTPVMSAVLYSLSILPLISFAIIGVLSSINNGVNDAPFFIAMFSIGIHLIEACTHIYGSLYGGFTAKAVSLLLSSHVVQAPLMACTMFAGADRVHSNFTATFGAEVPSA